MMPPSSRRLRFLRIGVGMLLVGIAFYSIYGCYNLPELRPDTDYRVPWIVYLVVRF